MNLEDLLNPEPTIEVHGPECAPTWKLGGLCRYESTYGAEDYGCASRLDVYLRWYEVTKKTPKGCWVAVGWAGGHRKFVLNDARKRFAYPTEELARESFIARKEWQIRRLKFDLEHAEAALKFMGSEDA